MPDRSSRRSIRLQGYDYAQAGMYFVTICTYRRQLLFGSIIDGNMRHNPFGEVIASEWLKSVEIRAEITLDTWIVMPNHLHGIVIINEHECSCESVSTKPIRRPQPRSLSTMIAGFKSATTSQFNQMHQTTNLAIWQRNYWEHIIRDDTNLDRIRTYIVNNPTQWQLDKFYQSS